jgi:hypothetical protein
MDRQTKRWKDRGADRQMKGQMVRRMSGRTDKQKDGQTEETYEGRQIVKQKVRLMSGLMERPTERCPD